jgi:hypothetical protein
MSQQQGEDIEDIVADDSKTDLVKVSGSVLSRINWKMILFLSFISMIIFSDIFIEGVLHRFEGTTIGDCTTTKGTLIQIGTMVVGYAALDLAIQYEFI